MKKKESVKEKHKYKRRSAPSRNDLMSQKNTTNDIGSNATEQEKIEPIDSVKKTRRKSVPSSRPRRDAEVETNENKNGGHMPIKSSSTKFVKDTAVTIQHSSTLPKERKEPITIPPITPLVLPLTKEITGGASSSGKSKDFNLRKEKKVATSHGQTKQSTKKHKKGSKPSSPRGEPPPSPRTAEIIKPPSTPRNETKGGISSKDTTSKATANEKKLKKSKKSSEQKNSSRDTKGGLLSPPEKLTKSQPKTDRKTISPRSQHEHKKHKKLTNNMENPFVAIKSIASPGRKKRTVSKHILKKDMNGKEEKKKDEDKQKIKEVKRKRKIKKIHRKNSDAIPERKKRQKDKNHAQSKSKQLSQRIEPVSIVVKEGHDGSESTHSNSNTSEKESDTSNSEKIKRLDSDRDSSKQRVTKRKRTAPAKVAPPSTSKSEPQNFPSLSTIVIDLPSFSLYDLVGFLSDCRYVLLLLIY